MDRADELLERVRGSSAVLLTGPEGPDGDSIGACLALRRLFEVCAPGVRVDVTGRPGHRYAVLPDAGVMLADEQVGSYDAVIVLDGDRRRVSPRVALAFDAAAWTGLVDHHRSTDTSLYTVSVFDPAAESACGLVYNMALRWGVPLDRELAALLYTGVIFDTGGFRYSNTQPSTHQMAAALLATGLDHTALMLRVLVERRRAAIDLLAAVLRDARYLDDGAIVLGVCSRAAFSALGAEDEDAEGIVDTLQHICGVELAGLLLERSGGRVKVSLRSRGAVDVASLAHGLDAGGGGHAKAAGVMLTTSLADAEARLVAAMRGALADAARPRVEAR